MAAQKHENNPHKQNKPKNELEAKKINVNEVGITESKKKKGFEESVWSGVREVARVWGGRKGESAIRMERVSCDTKVEMVWVERIMEMVWRDRNVECVWEGREVESVCGGRARESIWGGGREVARVWRGREVESV